MRNLGKGTATLALIMAGTLSAQTLCEAGYAGAHPCDGIDLMSVRSWEELGGTGGFGNGNDCWGWVKEEREFVLYGRSNGLAVVEVTDPVNPIYLANLPTQTGPSLWRDVKVYGDYAFVVSEAGGHGMQVLNLNDAIQGGGGQALQMLASAHFDGFGHAHNIAMNESTGYAYPIGTNEASGGLLMINVQDPSEADPLFNFHDGTTLAACEQDSKAFDASWHGTDGLKSVKAILLRSNGVMRDSLRPKKHYPGGHHSLSFAMWNTRPLGLLGDQ